MIDRQSSRFPHREPGASATSPLNLFGSRASNWPLFKIDENLTFFVADGEFGLSIQLACSDHRSLGGINRSRIMTSAVKVKTRLLAGS